MSDITTTSKQKDHGQLRFNPPPDPEPVWIPKALRNLGIVNYGGDYNDPADFSAQKYGWWPMVALRDVHISGNKVAPGESFSVPGNAALELAWHRDSDFLDTTGLRRKELDFEKTQKELASPVNWQTEAAFQKRRPPNHHSKFPDLVEPRKR